MFSWLETVEIYIVALNRINKNKKKKHLLYSLFMCTTTIVHYVDNTIKTFVLHTSQTILLHYSTHDKIYIFYMIIC